ncbi:MAG: DNA replication/repair protein RecF [Bacillota bacterium]
MHVKEIEIVNFTNYQHLHLSFHQRVNWFIGDNGQGKSNLIDAIYYLSMGQSYKQPRDLSLIRWNEDYFYLKGLISNKKGDQLVECAVSREKKIIKVNGQPLQKRKDLLGVFAAVIFTPDDLFFMKGGPEQRRRFLNQLLMQISPIYYDNLLGYHRILYQRNSLLKKEKIDQKELEIWDEQLSSLGAFLINKRQEAVDKLDHASRKIHQELTGDQENLRIVYRPGLSLNRTGDFSPEKIKVIFQEKLKKTFWEDRQKKYTQKGPHRDELIFQMNGIDLRRYGSQGQQRTAVLALKLASMGFLAGELGEYPVLLLDDVFSELDGKRRDYLIKFIADKIQSLITSTDLVVEDARIKAETRIFKICQGKVI